MWQKETPLGVMTLVFESWHSHLHDLEHVASFRVHTYEVGER